MKYKVLNITKAQKLRKGEVCPICGKPDWCFSYEITYETNRTGIETYKFVACRRVETPQTYGYNGDYFSFEKLSSDGAFVYEEINSKARRYSSLGLDVTIKPKSTPKRVVKKIIEAPEYRAPIEKIDEVYRFLLDSLDLEEYHKEYLKSENWTDELINSSNFKSMPAPGYVLARIIKNDKKTDFEEAILNYKISRKKLILKLIEQFGDLTGIPGFYKKSSGQWEINAPSGMLMPMFDIMGRVFALRIRKENGSGGPKYIWLSSFKEETKEDDKSIEHYNKYELGSPCLYGVSYLFPDVDTPFLLVTEGEKKQKVVSHLKKIACANIPGVAGFKRLLDDIEQIKERGIKYIVIGYDADKASNAVVLKYELQLIRDLYENGFEIYVANWNEEVGKGIDDILLNGSSIQYDSLINYLNSI